MARSTKLWVGKTHDSRPPPSVRLRVFNKYDGKCHLSGVKIHAGDKWELDHVIALINGGSNSEDNLAPALTKFHKEKTRADVAEKAKVASVRKRHLGITKPKSALSNSKFKKKMDGTVVLRSTGEPV